MCPKKTPKKKNEKRKKNEERKTDEKERTLFYCPTNLSPGLLSIGSLDIILPPIDDDGDCDGGCDGLRKPS